MIFFDCHECPEFIMATELAKYESLDIMCVILSVDITPEFVEITYCPSGYPNVDTDYKKLVIPIKILKQ